MLRFRRWFEEPSWRIRRYQIQNGAWRFSWRNGGQLLVNGRFEGFADSQHSLAGRRRTTY